MAMLGSGDDGPARMQKRQRHPASATERSHGSLLTLRDLLGLLAGTRSTRLERLCWDLNIDESRVRPAWEMALRVEFFEPTAVDPLTGQAMYRLSDRGRDALRELRRRSRRAPAPEARSA
jgi:hypothetical protein